MLTAKGILVLLCVATAAALHVREGDLVIGRTPGGEPVLVGWVVAIDAGWFVSHPEVLVQSRNDPNVATWFRADAVQPTDDPALVCFEYPSLPVGQIVRFDDRGVSHRGIVIVAACKRSSYDANYGILPLPSPSWPDGSTRVAGMVMKTWSLGMGGVTGAGSDLILLRASRVAPISPAPDF